MMQNWQYPLHCTTLRLWLFWEVWILNNLPSGPRVDIVHGCSMFSEIDADALKKSRLMLALGLINLISCLLRFSVNVNFSLKTYFFCDYWSIYVECRHTVLVNPFLDAKNYIPKIKRLLFLNSFDYRHNPGLFWKVPLWVLLCTRKNDSTYCWNKVTEGQTQWKFLPEKRNKCSPAQTKGINMHWRLWEWVSDWEAVTHLLMYSALSTLLQTLHLKQPRCQCFSRATRDCSFLNSFPQPQQSEGDRGGGGGAVTSIRLLQHPFIHLTIA